MSNKIPSIVDDSESFVDDFQLLNHQHKFVKLTLLDNLTHTYFIILNKNFNRGYFFPEIFQYSFIKRLNRLLST